MPEGIERLTARLPFKTGALIGACAFLVGYLITYAVTVSRVRAALSRMQVNAALSLFGSGGIPPWKITGWLFYGAHFVDVTVTSSAMDISTSVLDMNAGDARVLLFLVPPVLLLAAGLLAAHLADARQWTVAAAAGLTVVPGYFALAFVGAFLTQVSIVIAAVGPELSHALAAGIVYPLVFGPLGGVLVVAIQHSRASNSPHGSNP